MAYKGTSKAVGVSEEVNKNHGLADSNARVYGHAQVRF